MRNNSFIRTSWLLSLVLMLGIAVILAIDPCTLHAQCSDDSDSSSFGCQMQQPSDLSQQMQDEPGPLNPAQTDQQQPRAHLFNQDTATNGLAEDFPSKESNPKPESQPAEPRLLQTRPDPPTEFQRFVADTTGQVLPIYGARFFANQQITFGPVNDAPAPADLVLSAGDELQIRIWGQINFSANLRISRTGELYLPKVGAIHVAGMTVAAAQEHLRQAMDRIYRNFELTVDLGEIHSIQIYVTGLARQPGEYTVSALSTLVDAVFLSGGPSPSGSLRHIQLKRAGKVLTDFDLYQLLVKGDKTGDMQLQPGDVLYIPPAGPQVAVLGSVREPGIYELRGEETVADLLDSAGGRTALAAGSRIALDRTTNRTQRGAFELSQDAEGLGTKLADGDIVRIDAITSHYSDTVTLRGSVANPGHFRWYPGMRLNDLIPDRDSLVTRGYWWRRAQLGLPAPEFSDLQTLPNPPPTKYAPTDDRSIARTPKLEGEGLAQSHAGAQSQETDLQEQEGTPYRPNGKTIAVPSPGGETDWDYAVIERLDQATMKTSLIPFDLGKLVLKHDPSQDLELQPGDVVTIFSQDDIHLPIDQRTKYVQLEGEIVNAGVYSVSPGETLRSLVERAGGLTSKAYLYGAEFTRRSTQALEQRRMNDYADHLAHLMQRNALLIQGGTDGGMQNGLQSTLASANRGLVDRLRQTRATGRIVLNLSPESDSVNDLPNVELEDGDRLVIPSRPSTIQVIGSVFNQNAFLCTKDARVGEYLRLAGGPTREADRRQIFILRADGSVVHQERSGSIFSSSSLNSVRLYPGDTVIVPEKIVRPSGLRALTDWTQILSQLSISAAALDVVK